MQWRPEPWSVLAGVSVPVSIDLAYASASDRWEFFVAFLVLGFFTFLICSLRNPTK